MAYCRVQTSRVASRSSYSGITIPGSSLDESTYERVRRGLQALSSSLAWLYELGELGELCERISIPPRASPALPPPRCSALLCSASSLIVE